VITRSRKKLIRDQRHPDDPFAPSADAAEPD